VNFHADRPVFTADAGAFAVAGRQLEHSGSLATLVTTPGVLRKPMRPPFPVSAGAPMVPLMDAAMFALGGDRAPLTLVPPGLAYLAVVWLSALLALRLSGSEFAAWVAGGAVALSASLLYYATQALTEMPFAAFLTAALLLLWDLPRRPRFALLGVCLGLAQVTRPVMPFLLPAWVVGVLLLAPRERRSRGLLVMLAVYLPAFAVLPLYRWLAFGDPSMDLARYNLLAYLAPEFAPWRIHRWLEPPDPVAFLFAHPGAVLQKLLRFGPSMMRSAIEPESPVFAFLAAFYLVSPSGTPQANRFRATVLILLGLTVAVSTLTIPDVRYVVPLWPAVIALATVETWLLVRLRGHVGRAASALCAALILLPLSVDTTRAWRDEWSAGPADPRVYHESEWRALGRSLAARLPSDAVVVSDVGTWISWYANLPTLALPDSPDELRACERRLHVDAMVLTDEWVVHRPGSATWAALYRGNATLRGWVRSGPIESGRLNAVLFLRDGAVDP
jgi:hypothetical protein